MPQLTTEQRVFVVTEYARTQNSTAVQQAFQAQFPEHDPPPRSTILQNFRKYQAQEPVLIATEGTLEGQEQDVLMRTLK